MVKIKIIQKEREIEGEIFGGKVTPFGTSAHIPFSKKFIGRKVKVIVPEESKFFWVLSEKEKKYFIAACKETLEKQPESRLTFFKRESIDNLKNESFDIDDLQKALAILEESNLKKDMELADKVNRAYGL